MEKLASLVVEARGGDLEAYGQIVERFQDMAVGYAASILGDFDLAKDAAQEAFIQAYRDLPKLREPAAFPGWFRTIVFKHCDRLVRGRRATTLPLEAAAHVASSDPGPARNAERREMREKVLDAIRALPEKERTAATLYYIDGYSQKEVAEFLEVPVATVKNWLFAARNRLKERMTAMVEKELKESRPDEKFSERVLRKISQVRLSPKGVPADQSILLTDSKGRSFVIVIGVPEADALRPWLEGGGSPDDIDIHTALVRSLGEFDCRIRDITVSQLKANTFYGDLRIDTPQGIKGIDCRPSDGINFAVRAGAPIFVDPAVADQCLLKKRDGTPMSPAGAWRFVRKSKWPDQRQRFRNIAAVLKALEKDPESSARAALREIHIRKLPPMFNMVEDLTGGMEQLKAWTEKHRGTRLEGLGSAFLGSFCLMPSSGSGPEEAIPYLETAHRLFPGDRAVAFELASAYAMAGKNDEAFSILAKKTVEDVRRCGNFRNLWDDPRFRRLYGEPPRELENSYFSAWLGISSLFKPEPQAKKKKTVGEGQVKSAAISASRVRSLENCLGGDSLLAVEKAWIPPRESKAKNRLMLEVEGNRAAVLRVKFFDEFLRIMTVLQAILLPRPLTQQAVCTVLDSVGIRIEAGVLLKRRRFGIEGALVLSRDREKRTVAINGIDAVAVAFAGKLPLLITQELAEKLYLRGKSGRPLTPQSTARKLFR